MRVVGYVRETTGSEGTDSSYAQSERIRRWAGRGNHALVAVCQDLPHPGHAMTRDGYRALLGIVEAGEVDVVVVPGISTLSDDKVLQEIMLWDLRSRGVTVLGTEDEDLAELAHPPHDPARVLIRDVLARSAEYHDAFTGADSVTPIGPAGPLEPLGTVVDLTLPEVVVELLPAEGQAAS